MARAFRDSVAQLLDRLRLPLVIFAVLLGIAMVALPLLIRAMDDAVDKSLKHDIAWTGQHGRSELYALARAIISAEQQWNDEARSQIELSLDILFSRLNTWRSGSFGEFVGKSPKRKALLDSISDELAEMDRIIRQSDIEKELGHLSRRALALESVIGDLASEAYDFYQLDKASYSARLRLLQKVHNLITLSLVGIGVLLIVGLFWSNRNLEKSYGAQRRIAQENAYLASFDMLTGLANRKSFLAALEAAIDGRRPGNTVVVVAIDLDGFKPINDVLGHKAGDALLAEIGRRLIAFSNAQAHSCSARFGGDEFMVMLDVVADLQAIEALACQLHECLRAPLRLNDHFLSVDATLGLSLLEDADLTAAELVHRADLALTNGKLEGKSRRNFFDEAMLSRILHRARLEFELNEADLEREIEPVYQPIVDLPTRRIIGVEALVRWRHPQRGLVSPGEFITAAESSGKIAEIGRIMLERACRDAMLFPVPITVSVNLSPVQLMRMDVVEIVGAALSGSGLPPHRLKLEITESVMLQEGKGLHALMRKLQGLGVTISLDDFGTGYSSLSYLRNFPFNEVKIDRLFLSGIVEDQQASEIVQTIMLLARALNMNVVAEGIESEGQAATLMALGCARGQGFLFARPMSFRSLCQHLDQLEPRSLGAVA